MEGRDVLRSLGSPDNLVTWLAGAGIPSGKPRKRGNSRHWIALSGNSGRWNNEPLYAADWTEDWATHGQGLIA